MRITIAAFAACLAAGGAQADTLFYGADIGALNATNGAFSDGFGASGRAAIAYDTDAQTLNVRIRASGLFPGEAHLQHIHGVIGGDAVTPTLAANDADGDGFVELLEGVPAYGPILLNLLKEDGTFPVAPANGHIDYMRTFDLTSDDVPFDGDFGPAELMAANLENREIVLHGAFVPEGLFSVDEGQPDGITGAYNPVIPVAAGEITRFDAPAPVPLPAAAWMLLAGIGGLGAARLRRKN